MRPPDFGQADAYTNAPPPFLGPIFASFVWPFSLVSSKIFLLATLARLHPIKFLFLKLKIWACSITSKSNYIFSIIVGSQLPKCTKTHIKLHKIALHIKCPKLFVAGGPQTPQLTENWIRCTHPECIVGRSSPLNLLEVFTAFPQVSCS